MSGNYQILIKITSTNTMSQEVLINTQMITSNIVTMNDVSVEEFFNTMTQTIVTTLLPVVIGPDEASYEYDLDLLPTFRDMIRASILQNRVTMDTANIATPHRMAYLSLISQLDRTSQILDAIVPAVDDTKFSIPLAPMLILSVLSSVTNQYYLNSNIDYLSNQSSALSDFAMHQSKIATAALQFNVDLKWYTTWGKQR